MDKKTDKTIQDLEARIAELEGKNKVKNIIMAVQDEGILVLEIDLNKEFGESKSGKSITVASTGGFLRIPDHEEFSININVVQKK